MTKQLKPTLTLEQQAFTNDMKNPRYRVAFSNNMTSTFKRQPKINKSDGLNSIYSVYGKTGSGKSIVMWNFADWNADAYNYSVTADQMHFNLDDFRKFLEQSNPGDFPVWDEADVDIYGEGSLQVMSQVKNIEKTIREGEVGMGYCGPELRLHSHHFIFLPRLKLWHFPEYKKHMKVFSWVFDGLDGNMSNPLGYIITGLPKGSKIDWKAKTHKERIIWPEEFIKYRKKKHDFIKQVKSGDVSSGAENVVKELAEKFIEKYEDQLPYIDSKKRIITMMNMDKDFRKNLTSGMKQSVADAIVYICELEGIDCKLIK